MKHRRTMCGAVFVAGLLACGEATPTVSDSPPPLADVAIRSITAMLDDAATRSTAALDDARVARTLRQELTALSDAIVDGRRDAALIAIPHARRTLLRYSETAGLSDAADRAVIDMALDRTEQRLRADAVIVR